MDTQKPLKVGRFSIIKPLGRGLHGAVFLANDPHLQRRVAIKVLHHDPADPKPSISPQAKNLAQLRHPNIVSLYDAGIAGDRVFLVCELLEGKDLRQEIHERGALPLPEAVSIGKQILDGMAFAHNRGILHMDLTPANVMRDREGRPRIMDFDLSRRTGTEWEGELTGTLRYITPEHTTTRKFDTRTDVYALGLILYELIAGEPVVRGSDQQRMVEQIRKGYIDWEPLRQRDPAGAVTAVIAKALQHDPAMRYADAGAMLAALTQASRQICYMGDENDPPMHGTIEFMLRRIERKGDFPAISKTLMEINRLTAADSQASAEKLANVILRDYAMTNRLLKLASSAFYGNFAGPVRSVSDAIRILGLDQVRMACNGLACFGHFTGKAENQELKDMLISSFVTGLLTRFLASRCRITDIEEAFICGMLHDLGKTLTIYYFNEDYHDICQLIVQGADEDSAARSVLGIRYPELGYAIAREWAFPDLVLYSMADHEMKVTAPTVPHAETLRCVAVFANQLCAMAGRGGNEGHVCQQLQVVLDDLHDVIALEPSHAAALLSSALEKFRQFASVLDVRSDQSLFMRQAAVWLERLTEEMGTSKEDMNTRQLDCALSIGTHD